MTSLKYIATDGTLTTLASDQYVVNTDYEPGLIYPKWGTFWPPVLPQPGAVQLTFQAGYDSADDVPEDTKQAILFLTSYFYESRFPDVENQLTDIADGIEELLNGDCWGSYA